MALTRRQKQVMDFLCEFIEGNGYSPSYEEIAKALRLASLATVHKHVQALEAKSYVRRAHNQSRSLEICPRYLEERGQKLEAGLRVPLLGRIAAGVPVEAVAGQESLNFSDLLGSDNMYALEVRGDSMIGDHICSGDYVLVEKTAHVRDGEIVVALVGGMETTLKRFYRENGGQARLQPANAAMEPIFVPLGDLQIQGRVLAVLRRYR
jgi:repressor LexA